MKILHVIRSTDPRGGGPIESIVQANKVLQRWGHTNHIVCLDTSSAPWVTYSDVPISALGPAFTPYSYSPRLSDWLQQHVKEYDAVVIHGLWRFPSWAVWKSRTREVPYFVYVHGMLDPVFKSLFPVRHIAKWCVWKLWEHRVISDASAVLFTCEEERLRARQSFRPYQAREAIVPYCVGEPPPEADAQRERFLSAYPGLATKIRILFLSRIHPKKGCDTLIRAFARIVSRWPATHLIMAGPDPVGWRSKLENMAESLGIARNITWTGMLTGDLKWGAFRCADVFVLPSHQENFGIAVVEALACGVPVIITQQINIWREISEDGAALTIPKPDTQLLEKTLEEWLALSQDEKAKLRERARECFATRFESEQAARRLLHTLETHHPTP